MSSPNSLPPVTRLITAHNADGEAIFEKTIPTSASWELRPPAPEPAQAAFFLAYTTSGFPVNLNPATEGGRGQDVEKYEKNLNDPPKALSHENASVLRYVDFAPDQGQEPYMHRTISLDYGIVVKGQMEAILDSGEKRIMNEGDSCVQRATKHAWRNTSQTEWARMVFVLISSEPPALGGNALEADLPPEGRS
ncbi:unnamed protein product [Discula destructiva]